MRLRKNLLLNGPTLDCVAGTKKVLLHDAVPVSQDPRGTLEISLFFMTDSSLSTTTELNPVKPQIPP